MPVASEKPMGVPVALSTEMWAFPGAGMLLEIEEVVKAGLTPMQAITAATSTGGDGSGVSGRGSSDCPLDLQLTDS